VRGGVNGNASSSFNKISCHCRCVKLFMLLARNFSPNKSINNAVDFSDLSWIWVELEVLFEAQ
jgi:hypothetical protein